MLREIEQNTNNFIIGLTVIVLVVLALAGVEPEPPEAAPRAPLPEWERQMFARTLLGECGRCDDREVRWIAHVVLNRLRSGRYGEEIGDVVTYRRRGVYHFATWDPAQNRLEATGPHVDRSRAFRRMLAIADAAWQEPDPTGGATNFYHPRSMVPRGRVPRWAKGRAGVRVGGAVFFRD